MNRLPDEKRERLLYILCDGYGIRETHRATGHSKATVTAFVANFHWYALMSQWKVAPQYTDLDQFVTRIALPLNGRLRRPIPTRSNYSLLRVRAIVATARDAELGQRLLDDVLPLIHAPYTERRNNMLMMQARAEGAMGPLSCAHCGGSYGRLRHERICLQFGLA